MREFTVECCSLRLEDIAKSADAYLLCFDLSISQATNHVDTIQDLKQSYRDALGARATTQEISFFIGILKSRFAFELPHN